MEFQSKSSVHKSQQDSTARVDSKTPALGLASGNAAFDQNSPLCRENLPTALSAGELDAAPQVESCAVSAKRDPQRVSKLRWIGRGLMSVLKSSDSYGAAGNFLISYGLWSGVIGHLAAATWSITNQFRHTYFGAASSQGASKRSSVDGFGGLLKGLLHSPGFYRTTLGVTFLASAIEGFCHGETLRPTMFVLFATANAGLSHMLNADYWRGERQPSSVEKISHWAWNKIPAPVQSLLANTAVLWLIGDFGLGVSGLKCSLASWECLVPASFGLAGVALATRSSLRGGAKRAASALDFSLSAGQLASLSAANFCHGNLRIGIALGLWSVTSAVLALGRVKKASSVS